MNKQELVASIATKANLSRKDAAAALEGYCETVIEALQAGGSVQLTGFGTFQVSKRAARKGRNPATGETIDIPAKTSGKFKAGKRLQFD